jgi:hypothetical protein
MMACSIKSDDSSIISEESRAVATADDDDEEDDAKHRHSNDNATTETNYDSQEILDRIGKYPAEYHNRCPHSEEREIPHIRQDETWDCGMYTNIFNNSFTLDMKNERITYLTKNGDIFLHSRFNHIQD